MARDRIADGRSQAAYSVTCWRTCELLRKLTSLHMQKGLCDLTKRKCGISRAQAFILLQILKEKHLNSAKVCTDPKDKEVCLNAAENMSSCGNLENTAHQSAQWPNSCYITESWDTSDDEFYGQSDIKNKNTFINSHSEGLLNKNSSWHYSDSDNTSAFPQDYLRNVQNHESISHKEFVSQVQQKCYNNSEDSGAAFNPLPSEGSLHESRCESQENIKGEDAHCKLFVKNIDFRVTNRELRDFFTDFGQVRYCRILTKEINRRKRSRGCAHVTFYNAELAQMVLQLSQDILCLDGRYLVVEPLRSKRNGLKKKDLSSDFENCPAEPEPDQMSNSTHPADCAHISYINNDVMLHIFSFLTWKQKINIERVCKRWKMLSKQSWSQVQSLEFHNVFKTFGGLTDKILRSILQKNCCQLKSLDVSASAFLLTDKSLSSLGKYCPNIMKLNLSGADISNNGLKALAERCTNLQWIKLQRCSGLGEKGYWWLFHKCKNLKYINLEESKRLTGQCFHVLCWNVESIILNECYKMTDLAIEKIAERSKSLKELQLTDCFSLTSTSVNVIATKLKTLTDLHLNGQLRSISSSSLAEIGKLENLVLLDLSYNRVTDDIALSAVAQGCKSLRSLNLAGCYEGVSDAGISSLSACDHLTELNISYLHRVHDESIEAVTRRGLLQKLVACGCGGFTDQSMIVLSSICHRLQDLDLSGCLQISNSTLQAFVSASLLRETGCALTITFGGTSANPDAFDLGTNLKVSMQDHSVTWRRGDLGINAHIIGDDSDEDHYDFDEEDNDEFGSDYEGGGCGMSARAAEQFLEADDPAMEDEWNLS